jgi:hypothetical protein
MNEYISFYDSTGKIIGMASSQAEVMPMIKENTTDPYVDGEWFGHPVYVLDGQVTPRPANPSVLTGTTLTNVPVPATIKINDATYESNESRVELGFSQPGTYRVTVIAWPNLDKEFQIENPA